MPKDLAIILISSRTAAKKLASATAIPLPKESQGFNVIAVELSNIELDGSELRTLFSNPTLEPPPAITIDQRN